MKYPFTMHNATAHRQNYERQRVILSLCSGLLATHYFFKNKRCKKINTTTDKTGKEITADISKTFDISLSLFA
jgi:hypothetical protein